MNISWYKYFSISFGCYGLVLLITLEGTQPHYCPVIAFTNTFISSTETVRRSNRKIDTKAIRTYILKQKQSTIVVTSLLKRKQGQRTIVFGFNSNKNNDDNNNDDDDCNENNIDNNNNNNKCNDITNNGLSQSSLLQSQHKVETTESEFMSPSLVPPSDFSIVTESSSSLSYNYYFYNNNNYNIKQINMNRTTTTTMLDYKLIQSITTTNRRRKEIEIRLLQQMQYNDDAVREINNLWYTERGIIAARKLYQFDELISFGPTTNYNNTDSYDQAEKLIYDIIANYSTDYWIEPTFRLAKLRYLKGEINVSISLCHTVLANKPWHFNAVACLVKCYIYTNDLEQANYWARRRLPSLAPIGINQRRIDWVQNAIDLASKQLTYQQQALTDSFGTIDQHDFQLRQMIRNIDNDDDYDYDFDNNDLDYESWQ